VTVAWNKADLHIHSTHSDGLAKIPEIMDYVQERTDLNILDVGPTVLKLMGVPIPPEMEGRPLV
jgi:predicted AlkP superfamily phosphohydrolase/phosphomutase